MDSICIPPLRYYIIIQIFFKTKKYLKKHEGKVKKRLDSQPSKERAPKPEKKIESAKKEPIKENQIQPLESEENASEWQLKDRKESKPREEKKESFATGMNPQKEELNVDDDELLETMKNGRRFVGVGSKYNLRVRKDKVSPRGAGDKSDNRLKGFGKGKDRNINL